MRHLTYANLTSTLALVVALGTGTAYAANTIRSVDIVDGQVKNPDLAADAVGSGKIVAGGVRSSDLSTGAVDSRAVKANSLTLADLAGVNGPGTLSFSAGAVPDGRCSGYNVTVGGAKAGETLVVTPQAAMQNGVLLQGEQVTADGVGRIVLCNLSGTTLAAINGLPVRLLTFR
jgi:hypothetical protein